MNEETIEGVGSVAVEEKPVVAQVIAEPNWATLGAVNSVGTHIQELEERVNVIDKKAGEGFTWTAQSVDNLKTEVRELAQLIATQFGEPFTSRAKEIIARHKGE